MRELTELALRLNGDDRRVTGPYDRYIVGLWHIRNGRAPDAEDFGLLDSAVTSAEDVLGV